MANAINRTTTGAYKYEVFTGLNNGDDAASDYFTLKAPAGQKWIVSTVGEVNYMRPSDGSFTDINSGFAKTFDAGAQLLTQFDFRINQTENTQLNRFGGAVGGIKYKNIFYRRLFKQRYFFSRCKQRNRIRCRGNIYSSKFF